MACQKDVRPRLPGLHDRPDAFQPERLGKSLALPGNIPIAVEMEKL